jgi:aspartate racemase
VKTVGVLGGLGPQATMHFEALVHAGAQRLVAQRANSGYPPMIVVYFRGVPFVADANGAPDVPLRPSEPFIAAVERLGGAADFLVVISNFLHVFQSDIEQAAGCSLLSMVDLGIEEIHRRSWRRVGVLGFGDPFVYTERLRAGGVAVETVDGELRARLDEAVHHVMEGRADEAGSRAAESALEELRARGVDGTILACTEIPILLGHPATDTNLIDPLPLLAEATVRRAIG